MGEQQLTTGFAAEPRNGQTYAIPPTVAQRATQLRGRGWVFDQVAEWIGARSERFLLITGEPGSGKTALAGWFAGAGTTPAQTDSRIERLRMGWAATHFCLAQDQQGSLDPSSNRCGARWLRMGCLRAPLRKPVTSAIRGSANRASSWWRLSWAYWRRTTRPGDVQAALPGLPGQDARMAFIEYASARWASSDLTYWAELKSLLPLALSSGTTLDAVLSRVVGVRLGQLDDAQLGRALEVCKTELATSEPWELPQPGRFAWHPVCRG